MKRYCIALALLLGLSACSVTTPHIVEYSLKTVTKIEKTKDSQCKQKSLKLSQTFSANTLMNQAMRYTQGDSSEYTFSESKWSQSPNRALTQSLLESIRESDTFATVVGYRSRAKADYVLESELEEFMHYFDTQTQESYVRVRLALSLLESKSAKSLASVTFDEQVAVEELSASGGVKAYNQALTSLLEKSNNWLRKECR